jgi:hypothetical protein
LVEHRVQEHRRVLSFCTRCMGLCQAIGIVVTHVPQLGIVLVVICMCQRWGTGSDQTHVPPIGTPLHSDSRDER